MKMIVRAGLVCMLTLGLFHGNAAAQTGLAAKCSLYGAIKQNHNPTFQQFNCLLTNAAIDANIPPEVVKAVAWQENGWRQFDANGKPSISADGGIGVMQITNQPDYDQGRLKTDLIYNIESGVKILSSMYDRKDLPMINGASRGVIENWYFPVMAYNGIKPMNSPLSHLNGKINVTAYQEKVFRYIEKNSFLDDTKLANFPFKPSDFQYEPNSDANIKFLTQEYTLAAALHTSNYFFKKGDRVIVTKDTVVRSEPSTDSHPVVKKVTKFTPLTINGSFTYDRTINKKNQYVWYPVKTADQKVGFVSTAYIVTPPPCWQYLKSGKIEWKGVDLKRGQIGRLTILQNTQLIKSNGTFVRTLKKGEIYSIYAFKSDSLSVGGGLYVKRDPSKIKYETPSKAKLDIVKCIASYN